MPLVYRIMRKDEDGFPVIDGSATALGVQIDVDIDVEDGNAVVNHKGMSVNPHWRDAVVRRIPKRLGGQGSNQTYCFRSGEGPFERSIFAEGLELSPDSPKEGVVTHGGIRPLRPVPIAQFLANLAATRTSWQVDES